MSGWLITENPSIFATGVVLNPSFIRPPRNQFTHLLKVDSVYTRSTPMMEAVKIGGRLDLIECLLAAGGRLDVQVRVSHASLLRCLPGVATVF